jgi:hypothetical protein
MIKDYSMFYHFDSVERWTGFGWIPSSAASVGLAAENGIQL